MGKLLLWVVIVLVVMMVARIAAARAGARRNGSQPRPPVRPAGSQPAESMVRCAHCGIHLPRSEAVLLEGKVWCSRDHARLGER